MLTLFYSCATEEGEQKITVENRYSLEVPAFLSQTEDLHDDASLQYQNLFKEFYVLVIDEPKTELHTVLKEFDLEDSYSDDLNGYTKLILNGIYSSMDGPSQSDIVETNVNGLPARFATLSGVIEGIPISYTYGIYESRTRYYQVIAWTLADKQSEYQSQMDAILQSLKEFGGGRKKSY